ncbi:hypothetical protein INT47_005802 [Mucor saturninus]|uniref:Uncharacterized protein n=1 Tax=Mucor saturninus TaxID=64648 RepID=A0A8H7UVY6_9FUNG|nr:hypothetical protein INT47_005802 [Mucor saturninus]
MYSAEVGENVVAVAPVLWIEADTPCHSEKGIAIKNFISALHYYDLNNDIPGHNAYTGKVKIHLLTHIPQDIGRFGTVLQYETEKGEQFNKHIKEHITFTNNLNPSRDIGLKFGKQSMVRHVLEGGSWLNKNKIREKAGDDVIYSINLFKFGSY